MIATLLVALALHAPIGVQEPPLTADSPQLRISYEAFRKLHDRGEVLVLDMRSEPAYRAGHIPGAEWLSLDDVEARIPSLKREKRTVVTYCS